MTLSITTRKIPFNFLYQSIFSSEKMPFTPFVKTPLTDLTGILWTHQEGGNCMDLEMKVVNCLEAYGATRANEVCSDLMDDFKECVYRTKQKKRLVEMRAERQRQYSNGERTKEGYYAPPPKVDSFHP